MPATLGVSTKFLYVGFVCVLTRFRFLDFEFLLPPFISYCIFLSCLPMGSFLPLLTATTVDLPFLPFLFILFCYLSV